MPYETKTAQYVIRNDLGEVMSTHRTRKKAIARAKRNVARGTRRCMVLDVRPQPRPNGRWSAFRRRMPLVRAYGKGGGR